MWKWFGKSGEANKDIELEKLANSLMEVGSQNMLSESQKSRMFSNILGEAEWKSSPVQNEDVLLEGKLKELGRANLLSGHKRRYLYSGLMEQIKVQNSPWRWFYRSWKAGLASLMVFLLVMTTFVVAPIDLRVTRASKWTFLEDVQGKVYVNRQGKIMAVDKDFALLEGDLVFTAEDGLVTIRYLDDSVTRLGENTSLEIKKLYAKPDNAVKTQVELSLLGGQIWASVYNLIDSESKFVVETENARADVSSKATFEVKSTKDVTVLTVFDNVVDVSQKSGPIENIQPVIAGFKAEVKDNPVRLASSLPGEIVVEKNSDLADKWVVTNLDLDKQHQEKLKQENLQFASTSVASDNALSGALADFKDETQAWFANADIEAARKRFVDVQLGIIKAEDLLAKAASDNDNRRQASALMIQYKTALKEIMADFGRLHGEDAGQSDNLLIKMREEVDLQRKALSLVMPDEKLYPVKEVVNDAGLLLANDSTDRATYLLENARNRLLEMQSLIAKDDLKGAESSFRSYLRGLDDLVQEVEKAKVAEIEGGLFALIDDQIKQFKQLAAIESELNEKGGGRLIGMVAAVKSDSAKKLVSIIKFYRKNGIPFETVLELENTIDEYFADSDSKKVMMSDLTSVLSNYPEYGDFLKQKASQKVVPAENKDQSGLIKEISASAEVEAGIVKDAVAPEADPGAANDPAKVEAQAADVLQVNSAEAASSQDSCDPLKCAQK